MADETTPKDVEEESAPKKKSKKLLFIILGVVLLLALGGGGFATYSILYAKEDSASTEKAEGDADGEDATGEKKVPTDVVYIEIPKTKQAFNLKDPRSYVHFQMTIVVPEENQEIQSEIDNREPQITHQLISIFNEKTIAELGAEGGLDDLVREIKSRLTTIFDEDLILDVLISSYLIQQ